MALISGIIQYLYFYHWFISLTAMSSEFIHVEAYVRILSSYWRPKIFHCIYLLYFVYLFIWQFMFSHSVHILLFVTSWTGEHQASQSFTISQSLLKLMSTESGMPSNHLILCHAPLLLPSIFPSIRVFSNESVLCIKWQQYLEFQLQYQFFQWIFRVDLL